MKRKVSYSVNNKNVEREINYIPIRYIIAVLITLFEIVAVIGLVFLLAYYVPYFYIAIILTVIGVVISIIASNDNPDYKVPWLLFVITVPIIGMMCYFLFYERRLSNKYQKRYKNIEDSLKRDNHDNLEIIKKEDKLIYSQALQLINISNSNIYRNTRIKYYSLGEEMHQDMLLELEKAKEFIFLEFFIIEEGLFWNSILDILIKKAKENVKVKLVYDDIGCMNTLPGYYYKSLKQYNIQAVPFSRLKGQADNEFNNRSHRKIMVIDGKVGFTGGVNIADEYINKKNRFGHWKDTGVKLEGEAVNELTKIFLLDYYMNANKKEEIELSKYYVDYKVSNDSFVIPFGDGPNPIYEKNVGKTVIMNMLNQAKDYVYITTPYLIIDNELVKTIENTSLRGVDVRIILPHIPDKKLVFEMTKSNYELLIKSGVKIYEYTPGFIHSKLYLSDDKVAMIGTINLDYRSLIHHFENGVWIYNDKSIMDMKKDYINTLRQSQYMNDVKIKDSILKKMIRSIVRIFSPLL